MENTTHPSDYFRTPETAFWRWADGSVIEWKNGITICFREDLFALLRSLSNSSGVPSMNVTLLVLTACNDSWPTAADCTGILHGLVPVLVKEETDSDEETLTYYLNRAITGMNRIAQLPADWRKGYRRAHLLQEIVAPCSTVLTGPEIIAAIDEYNSLSPTNYRYRPPLKYSRSQFLNDLKCLAQIAEKYQSAQQLEQVLRTGLDAIPLPAPVEIPEQKPAAGLMQQLLEEPKTAYVSRLAKKIIAAVHIPMHLQRSGGQSYGGISDITNRGNFDRLLLSELANDDTMLMSRLVNNEALYLRREEPPHNLKTKRVLLIDSTLRLWGTPRVFAVSAALACTQNTRHGETIEAYTLGGNTFTETDLASKAGVITALEKLDPALHATTALADCLNAISGGGKTDCIFITTEETGLEPAFQKWLAAAGDQLNFLITVSRGGELHFSSVSAGRMKQLSRAWFDLEEVLSPKKAIAVPRKSDGKTEVLPAFFSEAKPPLLFPAIHTRHKSKPAYYYYHESTGLFGITEDQRLLCWTSKEKGAEELSHFIEPGKIYRFAYDSRNSICLVTFNPDESRLFMYYINDLHTAKSEVLKWKIEIRKLHLHQECALINNIFLINTIWQPNDTRSIAAIDCNKGIVKEYLGLQHGQDRIKSQSIDLTNLNDTLHSLPGSQFNRFINNGYTVNIRIKKIFINSLNYICLDNNYFSIPTGNYITLKEGSGISRKETVRISEEQYLKENNEVWLKSFSWNDGTTATVDSRGLLHLKSSDASLLEVTLVSIQGKSTACWAADGTRCGNPYFYNTGEKLITAYEFYNKYIAPIIQTILQKA